MLKYRRIYYSLSALLVVASISFFFIFGLKFGIDFRGGSLMQLKFVSSSVPSSESIQSVLEGLSLGDIVVQSTGKSGVILRFVDIDESLHQSMLVRLEALGQFEEERFESIGPVIGEETKQKAIWAIILVLIMILLYVAWAFRKISYPLGSWVYGLVALVTLFHDVLITIGVFVLLGHILKIEVGVPFVAALLTILGYSVNDTIVVFDRIRENILKRGREFDFGNIIDQAIKQTYVRSTNTSLTTFFVLAAIFLFGGVTIKYFVLTLMIGVAVGTYSSIFLASPLLFSIYLLKFRK